MRSLAWLVVLILALGCRGELIDSPIPGVPQGSGQPPTPFPPALAIRIGGPGSDFISALVADPAGGFILGGTFTGSADFDPGPDLAALTSLGGSDAFLARYSASGALEWVLHIGGAGDERVTALARDGAGNLYLGGSFEGSVSFGLPGTALVQNAEGGQDGFVAKVSSDGQPLWARRFGGTGLDEVAGLAVDPLGTVYAGGSFSGTGNAFPAGGLSVQSNGESDGFVLSLGSDGTVNWILPIGGPEADAVRGVALTSSGRIAVAGTYRTSADFARNGGPAASLTSLGGADAFLAVYSAAGGQLERVTSFGGPLDEAVAQDGLRLDPLDRFLVLGSFSGSVDFDPGPGTAIRTALSGSTGGRDVFLARYDPEGQFLSVAAIGGTGEVTAARALPVPDGTMLLAGAFTGPIDFDPGSGARVLSSLGRQGATDAFVARYTALGELVWVSRFGESTSLSDRLNRAAALALDPGGSVLVAGHFFGSPDFDPGTTAFRLTSLGEADGFVVKLTGTGALSP